MLQKSITIQNKTISIPAILWGEHTGNLYIAVHGNMSNKADDVIVVFAEEAVKKGYQVLSFDLPEHGERPKDEYPCKPENCVSDLTAVYRYARSIADHISFFGCSMGVYFGLLAYRDLPIEQSLFLSPVVNMERIIDDLMTGFQVSEQMLKEKQEIILPIGITLYWDYYLYVKTHPIGAWNVPAGILYGRNDDLVPLDEVSAFAEENSAVLEIVENGGHYFHTEDQMVSLRNWLKKVLS
ncbi:IS1595 family transposase [bioreactor metagenome]|uniref:IS1595 family transposase n=1 Tax=bioreactor metagenome TaxID=1076179 RepID=A0A644TXF0_9ZZZZ|nr:alpha/beta hydrolase [Methanocorpusculum sp.]